MTKPVINIKRDSPNAKIYAVIGIAHAAIMEEGFKALKECRDFVIDSDLIVTNAVTKGNLMKNKALHAASYEDALEKIEEYVTINWI
ncbi:MAG: hypothetical protein ACI3ZK_07405 [Candidatus Cryptobacteroides sp.]